MKPGLTQRHPCHILWVKVSLGQPRLEGWGSRPVLLVGVAATYCGHHSPASRGVRELTPGALTKGEEAPQPPEGTSASCQPGGDFDMARCLRCVHGWGVCDQREGTVAEDLTDILIHSFEALTYFEAPTVGQTLGNKPRPLYSQGSG